VSLLLARSWGWRLLRLSILRDRGGLWNRSGLLLRRVLSLRRILCLVLVPLGLLRATWLRWNVLLWDELYLLWWWWLNWLSYRTELMLLLRNMGLRNELLWLGRLDVWLWRNLVLLRWEVLLGLTMLWHVAILWLLRLLELLLLVRLIV
jgi:hypothetical protein